VAHPVNKRQGRFKEGEQQLLLQSIIKAEQRNIVERSVANEAK
jgi:hypothetical protein